MRFAAVVLLLSLTSCDSFTARWKKPEPPPAVARAVQDDPVSRYELKDLKHGNIVGMLLLDRKLGRVWILSRMQDAKGRRTGDEFQEVTVEDLWPSQSNLWKDYAAAGDDQESRKLALNEYFRLRRIKLATRPAAIVEADK